MTSHQQLEILYEQGLIVFPQKIGGKPMYKQYIGDGVPYQDVWAYQPNTKGVLWDSEEHIDEDVKYLNMRVKSSVIKLKNRLVCSNES